MTKILLKSLWLSFFLVVVSLANAGLLPLEQDNIRVFRQISPYVVNVHRIKQVQTTNQQSQTVSTGSGSGFLWNRSGYVVTNAHVVAHDKIVAVAFVNGTVVKAKVIAADRRKDIAVLKLMSFSSFPKGISRDHIPMADSDKLTVGQIAIAIGSPFGLSQTFTQGVVSALNRDVMSAGVINTAAMIQTDASINPGNSGGPLLDSQGHLIGMNTLIYSNSGLSTGIGFAIPSNVISTVVNNIIKNGKIIQPGIGIVPLNDLVAKKAGFPGVIISQVLPQSPAERVGLRGLSYNLYGQVILGDIIIGINQQRITTVSQFFRAMDKIGVNKNIVLHIYRHKKQYKVKIKVINLV